MQSVDSALAFHPVSPPVDRPLMQKVGSEATANAEIQQRRSEVVEDVAALERLMADVLPKLVGYRIANATPDETKVVEYSAPKRLEELLLGAAANGGGSAMPARAGTHDEVLDGIQVALDYSVRTGHPRFFDKLYAGSDSIGQVRSGASASSCTMGQRNDDNARGLSRRHLVACYIRSCWRYHRGVFEPDSCCFCHCH